MWAIAERELRAMLQTPTGWLVLSGFLLLTGVFWVSMVMLFTQQSADLVFDPYGAAHMSLTDHLLVPFFGNTTVILLLTMPAVAMGTFANEYRRDTMELLLTSPIPTRSIVLGKFIGSMGFVILILLATLPQPLSLLLWARPEPGVLIGGYLALLLLSAAVVAMGMWFSSMTSSQVVALVLGFSASLTLWVATWVDPDPESFANRISLATHVEGLLRGAVHLSDLTYFGLFVGLFLLATHQRVESHRWS